MVSMIYRVSLRLVGSKMLRVCLPALQGVVVKVCVFLPLLLARFILCLPLLLRGFLTFQQCLPLWIVRKDPHRCSHLTRVLAFSWLPAMPRAHITHEFRR